MLHVSAFWLTQVLLFSAALAQGTAPAPGATGPAPAPDSGFNPLWLLIILALIAAAVWYFMRRRSTGTTTATTTDSPLKTGVYDRDKK